MYYLLLLISFMIIVTGCQEETTAKVEPEPIKIKKNHVKKDNSKALTLSEKLKQISWQKRLNKSYSIILYYAFLDTPDYKLLDHYLKNKLKDIWPQTENSVFKFSFRFDINNTEKILRAADIVKDLGYSFFRNSQGYEIALGIGVSYADKKIYMRSINLNNGRLSPKIAFEFNHPRKSIEVIVNNFYKILGLEGYIVNVKDKKVTVVFRWPKEKLSKLDNIFEIGSYFWIFNKNKKWKDSVFKIERIKTLDNYITAVGEYEGTQVPKLGLKLSYIYFPGGKQTFCLVNDQNEPLQSFSIFSNHHGFSTLPQYYSCTTDFDGKFEITDNRKKPIFLVVAKNVEGVNFAFVKKILVITPGERNKLIKIKDIESFYSKMSSIPADKKSKEKILNIKRTARIRIEQAKEHLFNQELEKGLLAIKLARKHLQQLDKRDIKKYTAMLNDIEVLYKERITKRKARKQYKEVLKSIQKIDKLVEKLEYEKALLKLKRVEELWPKKYYEQDYKEAIKRSKRLNLLQKELSLPIGKARKYLVTRIFNLQEKNVDKQVLKEIYPYIKEIFINGSFNKDIIYNDLGL